MGQLRGRARGTPFGRRVPRRKCKEIRGLRCPAGGSTARRVRGLWNTRCSAGRPGRGSPAPPSATPGQASTRPHRRSTRRGAGTTRASSAGASSPRAEVQRRFAGGQAEPSRAVSAMEARGLHSAAISTGVCVIHPIRASDAAPGARRGRDGPGSPSASRSSSNVETCARNGTCEPRHRPSPLSRRSSSPVRDTTGRAHPPPSLPAARWRGSRASGRHRVCCFWRTSLGKSMARRARAEERSRRAITRAG